MEPLRVSSNREEILDKLSYLYKNNCQLTLWQNPDTESKSVRIIHQGRIDGVKLRNFSIVFRPYTRDIEFSFNQKLQLYVRAEKFSMLFKSKLFMASKGFLASEIPREIRAAEFRKEGRTEMSLESPVPLRLTNRGGGAASGARFMGQLLNVSSHGLAFLIGDEDSRYFEVGDPICLDSLGSKTFVSPLKAEIKYMTKFPLPSNLPYNYKREKKYRLGVGFKKRIPVAPEDFC